MSIKASIVSRRVVVILVAVTVIAGSGFYAWQACWRGYEHDQRILRTVVSDVDLYVSFVNPLTGRVWGLELHSTPEAPVTDDTLAHVAELRSLRQLLVMNSAITDGGLKLLEPLRHLWHLDIGGTGIGDDGIAALVQLPELEVLVAYETAVSDRSVEPFIKMSRLRELTIDGCPISDAAIARLAKERPLLEITRGRDSPPAAMTTSKQHTGSETR